MHSALNFLRTKSISFFHSLQKTLSLHRKFVLFLAIAFFTLVFGELNEWENEKILRKISGNRNVIKVTNEMTIVSKKSGNSIYYLTLEKEEAAHLSLLQVSLSEGGGYLLTTHDDKLSDDKFNYYSVTLPSSSKTGETLKIKFRAIFTHSLTPYPESVKLGKDQMVLYYGNTFVSTPYFTKNQSTHFKFGSGKLESYSEVQPVAVSGDLIKYGPYNDIPALQYDKLRIHYVNNYPFAVFTRAERDIEVSHWGAVAVEEVYDLLHEGATLSGGFSRLDYSQRRGPPGPDFRTITAVLPATTYDAYYRDIIGNISTSRMRSRLSETTLDLDMRFPMFGGWKTNFYLGYSVPLSEFVSRNGDNYKLEVKWNTPFANVVTDELQVQVILPEGSTDIKIDNADSGLLGHEMDTRFTFLDSKAFGGGRPVIRFNKKNVVGDHDSKLVVTYKFNSNLMFLEPMMLIGLFLTMFFTAIVSFHLKLNLRPSQSNNSSLKEKTE